MSRPEEALVRDTLVALCKAYPTALIMRNEANACTALFEACKREIRRVLGQDTHTIDMVDSALVRAYYSTPDLVKFGLGVGSADIVMCREGRWIALEAKSDTGGQSDAQVRWQAWLERAGGRYVLFRSVEEALEGAGG